jgi:hypothetical protein
MRLLAQSEPLLHEAPVPEQHEQVVLVAQVLERLRGVLDRELGDGGRGEDVLVYSGVQFRLIGCECEWYVGVERRARLTTMAGAVVRG